MSEVFGRQTEVREGLKVAQRIESADDAPPELRWRINDFPYALEDDVLHYILWSTSVLDEESIRQEIVQFIPTLHLST